MRSIFAEYRWWHDKLERFAPLFSKRRVKSIEDRASSSIFFSPPKWRNNRKMDAVDATRRKSGRIDTTRVHTKALQSLRDNIGIKRDYPPRIANVTGNITRSPCAVHAHTTRCRYPCEMVIRLSVVIHLWREFRGKNRLRNARIAPLCLISLTSSTDSLASTVDLNLKRDETFA